MEPKRNGPYRYHSAHRVILSQQGPIARIEPDGKVHLFDEIESKWRTSLALNKVGRCGSAFPHIRELRLLSSLGENVSAPRPEDPLSGVLRRQSGSS
jgi:hypothetical protein